MRSQCWQNDPFVSQRGGSRGNTIRAYLHFQPSLIAAIWLKVCAGTETKASCLCGPLVPAHTRRFCLFRHTDVPLRAQAEGGMTAGTTRWTRSSRRFLFSAGDPDNPFLSVMLPFRFPAAQRITERRPVVGVMCRWCVLGGEEEGVSIVTPRQWKDWASGLCRACPCVWESMKFSCIAGGWDTEEPFMIYYLAPMAFTPKSERLAELSSLHARVVTLPIHSWMWWKREKDTLVIVFASAFPAHSFQTLQAWQASFPKWWGHI